MFCPFLYTSTMPTVLLFHRRPAIPLRCYILSAPVVRKIRKVSDFFGGLGEFAVDPDAGDEDLDEDASKDLFEF